MSASRIFSVILLIAGIALLIWGFDSKESVASAATEVVTGSPSDKSIVLIVAGIIVAGAGLVGMLRRP